MSKQTVVVSGNCNLFSSHFYHDLKPAAHVIKELSKIPREAVCSAVWPRVRRKFVGKFASRGREENIKDV